MSAYHFKQRRLEKLEKAFTLQEIDPMDIPILEINKKLFDSSKSDLDLYYPFECYLHISDQRESHETLKDSKFHHLYNEYI